MSISSARRPLALLAVLGMVAALLFAVVGTASAADPANPALFKACPDSAHIPDPGFTDTAGLTAEADIDCIAYYGVTTGTSPTTYSPKNDVLRWQMALFLTRMATSAGVVLDPTPPDAGFTDIGHLPAARQLAINQLVKAEIVKGTSPTTYSPDATVIRGHMALFLTRFLGKAITGPGGTPLGGAAKLGAPFTDIGHVSHEQFVAINELWDLVITTGTTPTTYSPSNIVKRDQMASFMTRLMNHANSRPAGVNIQANPTEGNVITPQADEKMSTTVSVTTRTTDGKFLPAPNTVVDLWYFQVRDGDTVLTPFDTDGTCNVPWPGQIGSFGGSANPCVLDAGDSVTDTNGDVLFVYAPSLKFTYADLYAWTGATGATFDVDTTQYSKVTLTPTRAADGYTVEVDTTTGNVMFGDTVTWTFQVTDEGAPIAEAGWTFKLKDDWKVRELAPSPHVIDSGASNPVATLTTGPDGTATYTKMFTDPDTTATVHNRARYDLSLAAAPAVGPLVGPLPVTPIDWLDEAPKADSITIDTPTDYLLQADGMANTVAATVLDQYGNLFPGAAVEFWSNDSAMQATGIGGTHLVRHTNALGVAPLVYNWDYDAPSSFWVNGWETIRAQVTAGPLATPTLFYWVDAAANGNTTIGSRPVDVADVANKAVVGRPWVGGDYLVWTWDAGDQFDKNWMPSNMGEFETEIAKVTVNSFNVANYVIGGTSKFNVNP